MDIVVTWAFDICCVFFSELWPVSQCLCGQSCPQELV